MHTSRLLVSENVYLGCQTANLLRDIQLGHTPPLSRYFQGVHSIYIVHSNSLFAVLNFPFLSIYFKVSATPTSSSKLYATTYPSGRHAFSIFVQPLPSPPFCQPYRKQLYLHSSPSHLPVQYEFRPSVLLFFFCISHLDCFVVCTSVVMGVAHDHDQSVASFVLENQDLYAELFLIAQTTRRLLHLPSISFRFLRDRFSQRLSTRQSPNPFPQPSTVVISCSSPSSSFDIPFSYDSSPASCVSLRYTGYCDLFGTLMVVSL